MSCSEGQSILTIRHLPVAEEPTFQVIRGDGKQVGTAPIPSPHEHPVEGRPRSDLMRELQWYLEEFLDYPFSPETDHARRVLDALRDWGEAAFNAVFDNRGAGGMYDECTHEGYAALRLRVAADDPEVLAWPWEALRDPSGGYVGQLCRVERRVEGDVRDPQPLPEGLPEDAVNILLVIARPFEQDVPFRSVGRPLVELIDEKDLPARVTVLRPPTFDALRDHLHENKGQYHIVHFDGHGGFFDLLMEDEGSGEDLPAGGSRHIYSPVGHLFFELEEDGEKLDRKEMVRRSAVTAEQIAGVLREAGVPTVVLNACRSGMHSGEARDPFASVASALLQAGVRSVVAMAYNLYVSAAQEFLPAFYERLFEEGSVGAAVRAGRRQLFAEPGRVCARGTFDLQDWLVPVLYQQAPFSYDFATEATTPRRQEPDLGEDLAASENPYGFIGRDGPLLELERALRRERPAVLVQGLGGVGKTTLARGFCRWLARTGGLGQGCIWLKFRDIHSADYVMNRMGEQVLTALGRSHEAEQFAAGPMDERVEKLACDLRDNRFTVVWDNFESVAGIEGTSLTPNLEPEDRRVLRDLLARLRGGETKVLITSRSPEKWLGREQRSVVDLGGMQGEERWRFFAIVLKEMGRQFDRTDPDQVELMDLLGGHPLAMRVILPRLEDRDTTAASLINDIRNNAQFFDGEDGTQRQLFAAIRVPLEALPEDLRPLLTPLALHEGYVDAKDLEEMCDSTEETSKDERIDRFMSSLTTAGLLQNLEYEVFELHPVLSGYLRAVWFPQVKDEEYERWAHAFVDMMARLADFYGGKELHEQRPPFAVHKGNFQRALNMAKHRDMGDHVEALTQALAIFALNSRDFADSERLYGRLANHASDTGNDELQATVFHQLGMVAAEQHDLESAEIWHFRSLEVKDKLGNEAGAAQSYHELGNTAFYRHDLESAEEWYRRALEIRERLGIEHGLASDYHQLGMVAQQQRDLKSAEKWYRRSLNIFQKLDDEVGAARSYHQLGTVASEQYHFEAAEEWYLRAADIFERLHDEHQVASTYHELGTVAYDVEAAEKWYRRSLEISEKLNDLKGAARSYHQLGIVAYVQRDLEAAQKWCRCSLGIMEKLGDEAAVASSYHQLGVVAQEKGDLASAREWYRQSLEIGEKLGDNHGVAVTCAQLGQLQKVREDFAQSGRWYLRVVRNFLGANDQFMASRAAREFVQTYRAASEGTAGKLAEMWEEAGLGSFDKLLEQVEGGDE